MNKFIILIPVLNGELTLPYTLQTCCNQNYSDCQIVVSNNCSDDRTEEIIRRFQSDFPMIRYIEPPHRLSMSLHWEFAIGEIIKDDAFLIIIGSDDALMPGALNYANGLFSIFEGKKALAWGLSYYHYKDLPDQNISNSLSLFLGRNIEIRNALLWLERVADGKAFYHLGLANIYHGFVHTSLLRDLRGKQSGSLINSLSPDIYLSLALSTVIDDYIFIKEPLSLNCISNSSTGFSGLSPSSDGKIASAFHKENKSRFHYNLEIIPDLGIAHLDCLFQMRDLGLLPTTVEVNTKRIVGRAAITIFTTYRNHLNFKEYMEKIYSMSLNLGIDQYIKNILYLAEYDPALLPSKIDLMLFNEPYSYSRKIPENIVENCYQAAWFAQEIIIADENTRRLMLNGVIQSLNEAVRDNYQKKTVDAMKSFVDCITENYGSIWADQDFLAAYLKYIRFRMPPFDPTGFLAVLSKSAAYSKWLNVHSWSYKRCDRLIKFIEFSDLIPTIHFLLVVDHGQSSLLNKTLADLVAQVLPNWRLTVFSEHSSPSIEEFKHSSVMDWVQISSGQTDAITAVIAASPAEWFFCSSAGLGLSPAFTVLTGLNLYKRADYLFLYTDEDLIDIKGEHSQPKLKPDINTELLRSIPYIGAAVLICKSLMLDPRIAILPPGLARNYAASLLAVEQGQNAICHVDEILVHIPEKLTDEYTYTPLANFLIKQHLTRCGIVADVYDAPLPGALFVDYKIPTDLFPLVSIIVCSVNRLDLIQPCLESLLNKTDYPAFEILVIESVDTDPKLKPFLSDLQKKDLRIKILHFSQKYSYSAANNFAADQSNGEFLLFLSDDVTILEEYWLTRLVAIGARSDTGIVGCRVVSPDQRIRHAGLIMGLGGVVERIGASMPITEPGYMGRAQLAQNLSAVSADCMLVRKDLFFEAGRFDEKEFSDAYYDSDLCLKIGKHGYQVVWTPFVTLVQQENKKSKTESDEQVKKADLTRSAFIKKWCSYLGNDPAYNRHLSLRQSDWVIDGNFDVSWHPDLETLPRIVAQPPDEMGVGQYRVIAPLKELTDSERICSFLLPALISEQRFLPYVSELVRAKPTVLFLQNAFTSFHIGDLQSYAELLPDIFRVFGQDDIVFSVPAKSEVRKYFGKDTKARVRKAVSLCNRAIVTTEPIAEAMRGMVDDIRVIPNYLQRSYWGDLQQPPRNERHKLRVGWAGGQQHQGDLEFILPVVEATANEVDWIFMGMCPPRLRYHVAEVYNPVPFTQYPAALAALDLDLAIAPLEINRFNTAKSNLRLLEYGAAGYPVIATDILPYRNAPVARVPNNPKAWIDAIRAHVHDRDATRAAGERLREWVLSNWMLDQHLDEWMQALLPD